ncbi:Subtilisin-like protease SBT3 [Sesamum alatum]|uniref:Subtilisin-like protease SBT3 n=1 Tax=Sesamum alatum TaxID=300844 RepID=A0AAE2CNR2_9LAMI|nr:Subtilisin-like protease SBT3 [Sesamum alatum]
MGVGHINSNKALDLGLIYNANRDNCLNFLCAMNLTQKHIHAIIRLPYNCMNLSNPNIPPFIAYVNENGTKTVQFQRAITNMGTEKSSYFIKLDSMQGFEVSVEPERLLFRYKYGK